MIDRLFNSIVFKIGSMMFIISFVSIISMFSSVFISELAENDALAINHAGSLRMQSYKILSTVELIPMVSNEHRDKLNNEITTALTLLDQKFANPVLKQSFHQNSSSAIKASLTTITNQWSQDIQATILLLQTSKHVQLEDLTNLKYRVDTFVSELDNLVSLYQQHAEARIAQIRLIQGISLFITVILVVVIMMQLNSKVEKPLSELTESAKSIIAGDYTAHTHIMQNDELGFLSRTMNQMADAIAHSHIDLEKRVKQKTSEVVQSKESLELLYETSNLFSQADDNFNLDPIITKLANISGLNDLDLCLMTDEGSAPYEHILTLDKELSENCLTQDCGSCVTNTISCNTKVNEQDKLTIRYPIVKGEVNYGVLVCNLPSKTSLATWQHQLLQSITNQIATGLQLKQQAEQNRRLTLINERTVIARELHDSLAQALSYLKIQVTRLQKLHQKEAPQDKVDEVIDELKTGLNSAYRQLRELLTTFRLKIDNGLRSTFETTITQLNQRAEGKILFDLDYRIADLPLSPNEEIHLMQIAREATQNVLHHSKGSKATVKIYSDHSQKIYLEIEDNGVGIPDSPEKLNHYGLAIMKERATHLNGDISIQNILPSGVNLKLTFKPTFVQ